MRYLLPNIKYYKANLHTHTTISDGKLTPEEVKAEYKKLGYSILAITDHSVMVEHQDLCDPDFLLLTGCEIDVDAPGKVKGGKPVKTRHMCLIAKKPHHCWIPFRDPEPAPNSVAYFEGLPCENMQRVYTDEQFNAIIAKANEKGFFVAYNHPVWSLENYADYAPMKGLWGMEYRNTACISAGYDENNGQVYQDFLMLGNRMMPVCADDMHCAANSNGYRILGGSWNMIGAEKLDYASVVAAMERGDLYASCGPEIHSVAMDGTTLRICCSEAAKVQVVTHTRRAYLRVPQAPDQAITQAEISLEKFLERFGTDADGFIRIIITDRNGNYAVTRAYWMDELK